MTPNKRNTTLAGHPPAFSRKSATMPLDRILDASLRTQSPLLVWGPPGVGKTAGIRAWAAGRGLPCWTVIASLREPADFGGLPVVGQYDGGAPSVSFVPPRFATEAAVKGGVIFLDELSTAPPAVQAALLRAVMDRAFGDLELDPTRVMIVAAANPPDLAAGGWDLAPPLANRFVHHEYGLVIDEWVAAFPDYWGKAPAISFGADGLEEAAWAQARSLTAAFIRARPELLVRVPRDAGAQGGSWPSPRTWDLASRLWADAQSHGASPTDALPLVAGCVGEAAALEFVGWARELDLPDPEALLADPQSYRRPERGDQVYAVLSAVVQAALGRLDARRWRSAWEILERAAQGGDTDIGAVAARRLAAKHNGNLPVPVQQLAAYVPILKAAGVLPAD
jgi:hypothetical protein